MNLGDTFLNQALDTPEHLWIVASLPTTDGQVAIVNLTTCRPGCDETCLVRIGDHPFVRRDSVVAYQHAKLVEQSKLQDWVKKGYCRRMVPTSKALLARVQQGALQSPHTPQKVQAVIRSSCSGG